MPGGKGEGRPQRELTTESNIEQHSRGWYDRPHGELVDAFRGYVAKQRRSYGRYADEVPPQNIIHATLWREQAGGDERRDFFQPIACAFDAIAFERYEPGSGPEDQASSMLHFYEEPAVTLSDPLQVRILDALAEAVGIPHERGQAAIPIPEKLLGRNYIKWLLSPEREQEIAHARARKARYRQSSNKGTRASFSVVYHSASWNNGRL
jgi:hypothetical protein